MQMSPVLTVEQLKSLRYADAKDYVEGKSR